MSSKGRQLRSIVREYRSAGETWPATTDQIAAWAIKCERFSYRSTSGRTWPNSRPLSDSVLGLPLPCLLPSRHRGKARNLRALIRGQLFRPRLPPTEAALASQFCGSLVK